MARSIFLFSVVVSVACLGCNGDSSAPGSGSAETPVATAPPDTAAAGEQVDQPEAATDDPATGDDSADGSDKAAPAIATELKLDGISFMIPPAWKRVEPPTSRIVEAEYTLPRAEGDEFDGRLTLMAAGGDNDANIARWTGEFNQEPGRGAKIETMKISGVEATTADIRGEWKGSSFAPNSSPRADYRLLAVIIPFTERNSFYLKLTGPKETVAKYEEQFREFAQSARIKKTKS